MSRNGDGDRRHEEGSRRGSGARSSGHATTATDGAAPNESESDGDRSEGGGRGDADDRGDPGGRGDAEDPTVPTEAFREVAARLADGDLGARFPEPDGDESEAGALASDLNAFVADVADTLSAADGFGDEVAGASEHVRSNVARARDHSEDVHAAVDDIETAATTQRDDIAEATRELQSVSAATEEVAASAEEVATTAASVAERADEGNDAATAAIDELRVVDDRTETARERVESLESEVAAIEDVTDLIRDIADETNILALNASIEAARAGEAGAGFEVVAEEVKSLAEEAQEATAEIESSIDAVREETDATVAEIGDMRERVGEGIDTAETALEAFADLAEDVEETTSGVEEISEATDDQAASIEEAVDMVESVGALADDTAADAADVTTTAHTQKTSLTEVAAGASTLSDRAGALDEELGTYDLAGDAAGDDATVVEFWHALSGRKARLLDEFVAEFEAATDGIEIRPASKGSYRGVFDATLAAAERDEPPTIAHLYEIGTKRALDSGAFAPVESLLNEIDRDRFGADAALDPEDLLDPVANYYRTGGRLHSLPFNASTPVLYYDRAAFERAGLNPDDPPTTFAEVRHCAERLAERGGTEAGIAFANYSWFVEQWFAEAGQPLVDADNGRAGTPTEAHFDAEAGERVYEWIAEMAADGLYHDPGIEARGQAREAFHDGRAGMLIGSTSAMVDVREGASFPVETGYFPVADERHGVVVGGGSLWVADGAPTDAQRAAAAFLGWLAAPERQARWHRETGYLPVHEGAVDRLSREGWFDENPGYRTAMDQLADAENRVATTGARMGPFDTIRTLVAEASVEAREHGVREALDRLTESAELQLRSYAESEGDR